jgi:23S rRNA G2445 N2-methylase RlmL
LAARVAALAGEVPASSLDEFRSAIARLDLPGLEQASSFRVTAHAGPDASVDPQAAAGAAGGVLQERHGTPVDLRGFELEVRIDLGTGRALLSVELLREALDRRMRRAKPLRSALKPTLAAGLVRLAGAHRGEGSLLDPTCGSGTIAVEAKAMNPALSVHASDWDEPTTRVARATLANHGLEAEVRRADARDLRPVWERCFDRIVFNPPYGVNMARGVRIDQLYATILSSAVEVLASDGGIVVLTPRRRALTAAADRVGLQVLDELPLQAGELRPVAYRLALA